MLADTYNAAGYGLAGAANVGNNGNFNQFEGLGGDDTITGNGNTKVIYSQRDGWRDDHDRCRRRRFGAGHGGWRCGHGRPRHLHRRRQCRNRQQFCRYL